MSVCRLPAAIRVALLLVVSLGEELALSEAPTCAKWKATFVPERNQTSAAQGPLKLDGVLPRHTRGPSADHPAFWSLLPLYASLLRSTSRKFLAP